MNTPATQSKPENAKLIYLYSAIIILIWGTAYTLVGFAVKHISPAWIVASRTIIAALALSLYIYMRGQKLPPLKDKAWLWYTFLGFIGMTMPFYLMAKALIHIDSGLASILVGFMPLTTIVLAHFFVKDEPLSWPKMIGFLVGFLGIIILFLPKNFSLHLVENWQAQCMVLLGAILYAITVIIAKRAPKVPANVGATMMVIGASFWALIWVAFVNVPSTLPPQSAIWAVIAVGLGATGVSQIMYLRLIQISGTTIIAKISYLVPICALIAGIIFLDEEFGLRTIIAMAVIFLGLFIARSGDKA